MKTAILFALVCLSGYTAGLVDASQCNFECKPNGTNDTARVTINNTTYVVNVKDKSFAVLNTNQAGFVVVDNLIILVNKNGKMLVILDGNAAILELTSEAKAIFDGKIDVAVSIKAKFEAAVKFVIEWDKAINAAGSLDYNALFKNNANVVVEVQTHFSADFEALAILSKKTGVSICSGMYLVARAIGGGDVEANADYIQLFVAVVNRGREYKISVDVYLNVYISIATDGEIKNAQKYIAAAGLVTKFDIDLTLVNVYSGEIPNGAKTIRVEVCIIARGGFSISWSIKGKASSKVTVSFGAAAEATSTSWLTVYNYATGWVLYVDTQGMNCFLSVYKQVAIIIASQDIGLVDASKVEVISVTTIRAFIAEVNAQKKLAASAVIEACKTESSAALVTLGATIGLSSQLCVKVYEAFKVVLGAQTKVMVGFSFTYTFKMSSCIEICASSLSVISYTANSFGIAIGAVITAVSNAVSSVSGHLSAGAAGLVQSAINLSLGGTLKIQWSGSIGGSVVGK